MTQTNTRPFRWAILGTGPVARKFVLGLRQLGDAAAAHVVASRNPENAKQFAASLGVAHVATDYAEAVSLAEVDGVYIATPPALHETHALLAIDAGKATLIEKPFALDGHAARRIAERAQAADVFCMEAMWTRFHPMIAEIRKQVEAGALGDLRGFDARFMMANAPDPEAGLFNLAQGGGALMHRGVYPLSLARHLLGPITEVQTLAQIGETGVDEDSALTLRHASGALSTLRASLRVAGPDGATLFGTRATMHIRGPIWRPTDAVLVPTNASSNSAQKPRRLEGFRESKAGLRLSGALNRVKAMTGRKQTVLRAPFAGNGYHYQAEAAMNAVVAREIEDTRMPVSESVEIIELIDTARTQWSAGKSL